MTGRLYGVGVGPGDPELLTLKAARLIDSAQVIAYPAPDTGASFARSIVADRLSGKREIPIFVPMRIERFPAQEVYDRAAEEIANELAGGHDVVVLCEGDPFFYGSFMYLFERLAHRHPVEVVPGVSSLTAAAAELGSPLAERNDVLRIVPGPSSDAAIEAALNEGGPVAFIKVGRHFVRLRDAIARAGRLAHAGYAERLTLPEQRICALADHEGPAPYFSMILVPKPPAKGTGHA